jgi:hypothetical protein
MLTANLFLHANEGWKIKLSIISQMFERAHILYNIGWETDRMTFLQCSVLLSYFL